MLRRVDIDADLVVTRGRDRYRIRAAGDTVHVHIPGPSAAWRLWRAFPARRTLRDVLRRAGLRVKLRLGPLTLVNLGQPRTAR